jgi:hypothetical protein
MNQPNQNPQLALVKDALALLQCDWPSRVKLVEAVQFLESELHDLEALRFARDNAKKPTSET